MIFKRQFLSRMILLWVLLFILTIGIGTVYAAEFHLISRSQEEELGRETARKIEAKYGVYRNPQWNQKITRMGRIIAAKSDRPELGYRFKVLNTKIINAFALPGGYIYVTKGLMDAGVTDMELAGIVGHEIAHAAKRHSVRALERNLGIALLLQLVTKGKSGAVQLSTQLLQVLVDRGYSREYEFEADNAGAFYVSKTNYNPWGLVFFLERLQRMQKKKGAKTAGNIFSTHPVTKDRVSRLEKQMKDMKIPRPKGPGTPAVKPGRKRPKIDWSDRFNTKSKGPQPFNSP